MTTISIDGAIWLYQDFGWLCDRDNVWIYVFVDDEAHLMPALLYQSHGDDNSRVTLKDDHGWEWSYDGGWLHEDGDCKVRLEQRSEGGWIVSRASYGYAYVTLDKMTLDEALRQAHKWLESLWGSAIDALVWDENVEAFIGRMGCYDVCLFQADYKTWTAVLERETETRRHEFVTTDPRAAAKELAEALVMIAPRALQNNTCCSMHSSRQCGENHRRSRCC